jgi:hypothetical protein
MTTDAWELAQKTFATSRREEPEIHGLTQLNIDWAGHEKAIDKFCSQIVLAMAALHYCTTNPEAALKSFVERTSRER